MVSGAYTCNKRDHVIGHGKSSQKILYNLVLGYLGLLKDVFCKELIYQHYKELIYQQGNNNRKWLVQAWQFSHLFATQHFSLLSLICRSKVILETRYVDKVSYFCLSIRFCDTGLQKTSFQHISPLSNPETLNADPEIDRRTITT